MKYFDEFCNGSVAATVAEVKLHDDDDSVVRADICESGIREHFANKPSIPVESYFVLTSAIVLVVVGWASAKYCCPDVRINYETMECEAVFNVKLFVTFLSVALAGVVAYARHCCYELTH